jgi:hypothetical protein
MTYGLKTLLPALAVLTALSGTAALAHHSYGMFNMQQASVVEGTVKTFQWMNPHIWIDVALANGKTVSIEGDAIALMQRKGWTRRSMNPGDRVRITYHPLKSGQPGGSLVSAMVNGTPVGTAESPRPGA